MGVAEIGLADGTGDNEDMPRETRAFLDALTDLDGALDVNIERAHQMQRRIRELQGALTTGRPLTELVPGESPPLIVHLLTDSAETLNAYGNRLRRAEARALHREGMTMERIARLFGVTRQRVSALLRGGGEEG